MSDDFDHKDKHIDYIELSVTDMQRAKNFYAAAFDWKYTDYGPAYCEFNDGRMKGGFDLADKVITGGPLIVLYETDLKTAQTRVLEAGGKIEKDIFSFPGGQRFEFIDPEGNRLAIWSIT